MGFVHTVAGTSCCDVLLAVMRCRLLAVIKHDFGMMKREKIKLRGTFPSLDLPRWFRAGTKMLQCVQVVGLRHCLHSACQLILPNVPSSSWTTSTRQWSPIHRLFSKSETANTAYATPSFTPSCSFRTCSSISGVVTSPGPAIRVGRKALKPNSNTSVSGIMSSS
jgi:hypothetical protein